MHTLQKHTSWAVCVLLLLAVVMRIPHLTGSFWMDEAAQALESARPFSEQLNIRNDFQPPLLHLITHVSLKFSTAEWWLRLWGALIPGLVTIGYTYKFGKLVFSARVGVVAAVLLATSSLHIFFSQELRPYSLPAMLAILSSTHLLLWMATPSKQGKHQLLVFAVASLAGMYSSYLYPFFLLSQVVWVLLSNKKSLFSFATALGSVFLGYLPWIPMFLEQLAAGTLVRTQLPGWEKVVSIPQIKALPLVFVKFLFGVINVELTVPFIGVSALVIFLLLYLLFRLSKLYRSRLRDLLILLAVPITIAWIVSFWIPVVQPKRVLYLLPFFYLLVSFATVDALSQVKKTTQLVGGCLLLIFISLNLHGTLQYYLQPTLQRENWRTLHTQIITQYPAEKSVAVFSFTAPFAPWTWYDSGEYPVLATGALTTSAVQDLPELLKSATNKEYILVFDYLRDLTDPTNQIPITLMNFGYREKQVIDYPNIGFVRVFARQAATLSTVGL